MKIRDLKQILNQYDEDLDVFLDYEGYKLEDPDVYDFVDGTIYHTTHDGDKIYHALIFQVG